MAAMIDHAGNRRNRPVAFRRRTSRARLSGARLQPVEDEPRHQSGLVVVELEAAAMQLHDAADEAEAETVAGLAAALIEANEAFLGVFALFVRNAGAMIGNRDDRFVAHAHQPQGDRRSFVRAGGAAIFDGIVHEIGDGLRKKLAVGADTDARCKIEIEPAFGVFDRGTIKLGHA